MRHRTHDQGASNGNGAPPEAGGLGGPFEAPHPEEQRYVIAEPAAVSIGGHRP